jgi:hypothetical protein
MLAVECPRELIPEYSSWMPIDSFVRHLDTDDFDRFVNWSATFALHVRIHYEKEKACPPCQGILNVGEEHVRTFIAFKSHVLKTKIKQPTRRRDIC